MRRILGNASGMAVGTMLSRLTGVVRDIALIASIGTGVFADTYSVANSIPNIIYILVAGGAINAVFIPALVRHMSDDDDNGAAFIDRLFTVVGVVLVAITAMALACAAMLVRLYATSTWSASDFHVATVFALWCLPQIFFYGAYTLIAQVLNAREVFIAPMFAPIVNNIIVITTALVFLRESDHVAATASTPMRAIHLLGFGTTLGVAVQAVVLIPALRATGYRFHMRTDLRNAGLGKIGDLAIWTIAFVLTNQISFLVISRLTTYANVVAAETGTTATGFTSYQKAQLMMMLPHAVVTVSLITALLPRLSRHAASLNLSAMATDIATTARTLLSLIAPLAVLLIVSGPTLGMALYGHGNSGWDQGHAVGTIATLFAIGLPGYSLFYLVLRSYYAQEDTRTPFVLNLGFNIAHLCIGVTAFFTVPAPYRVSALAAAYSVAYLLTAWYSWTRLSRKLPDLPSMRSFLLRCATATALAGLLGTATHIWLVSQFGSRTMMLTVFDLAVTAGVTLGAYALGAQRLDVIARGSLRRFLTRTTRR
jgi:putative peptidoglycan lipid II flippase